MGRGKVQMKKIDNRTTRQVTFCKRKNGLMKKAYELSVLCDAEVGLIIFSSTGKLYEFSSDSMERTIENYNKINDKKGHHQRSKRPEDIEYWAEEASKLRYQRDDLSTSISQLTGQTITSMNVMDLEKLESMLEKSITSIRSKRNEKLREELENVKRREYASLAHKKLLCRKIEENESCTCRADLHQGLADVSGQNLHDINSEEAPENSNPKSETIQTTLQLG